MGAKNIYFFDEVDRKNLNQVGGKGGNLGEMTQAGLPVPPGYIVSAQAYFYFIKAAKLEPLLRKQLTGLNAEDTKKLQAISKTLKAAILKAPMPKDLGDEIVQAYEKLSDDTLQKGGAYVAVRSSATAEDLPEASFAGQQATYLNVRGAASVVKAVKRCFASLFEARAIYYRIQNNYDHMKVGLAVPVQLMVNSDASGIMFTADPVNSDETKIVIEVGLGLGEAIVSGSVTPDSFHVDKKTLKIIKKEVHDQAWKIIKVGGVNKHVTLTKKERETQKISDDTAIELAKMGLKIEEHYGKPQDTEIAIENGRVYLVQARPITTLGESNAKTENEQHEADVDRKDAKTILQGIGASIGVAAGTVRIIHSPSEIDKVQQGEVLVTEMTTPDYVPAMRRACAIVTDSGGKTSHAAIVSREMGIPCVVGTGKATSTLKTGQMITVDGHEGVIYQGKVATVPTAPFAPAGGAAAPAAESVPATGTKVYVNLGEPEMAAQVAQLPADGIGLMRAEFIITEIGEHPLSMIKNGRSQEYIDKLADGIAALASAFAPRPVVYRATDFKTNEYRNLKGGAEFEPQENNPMIGFRGASRYVRQPEEFALELEAIKKVRETKGLKNLWLMIPFVRTTDEFSSVRELVRKSGLEQGSDFKIWIMAEVPSTAILIDDFCALGIDGVSIGSNDLTQLTLGVDRDNETLAAEFDERDPAVLASIAHIARRCREHNVTCSICGQAASDYPEVVETLVRAGATSVSVSPDRVIATRKLIASVEKRIVLEHVMHEEDEHLDQAPEQYLD